MIDDGNPLDSIDPNENNKMAIHIACENGDLQMIKLLEKHGCEFEALDYEQMTPIYYAIKSENIEVIEYLLSKGVNLEHREFQARTPFYCACSICTPSTIEYLYKKGCNINALTKLNRSPLSKAAYYGREEIVRLLLSFPEIDIELVDNNGRSALHNAVKGRTGGRAKRVVSSVENCPEVTRLLLKKGANVNLKDIRGDTPLTVAACSYGEECIPILLEFGASINEKNNLGETPIYSASKYGHFETCKLLVENYNPNVFIKADKGYDAI